MTVFPEEAHVSAFVRHAGEILTTLRDAVLGALDRATGTY
jgi:hypothetical protein